MLANGVNVALGTDSRASNPDLSVLEEMRYVANAFPETDWYDVIRLGTLAGARALGSAGHTGSLTPGKKADFVVIQLPHEPSTGPETLLTDHRCSISHVCNSGTVTHLKGGSC